MFAKNSLMGVTAVVVALTTSLGCSRSGNWRAYTPKPTKQSIIDAKTKKDFVGSDWYFDFAVKSFPGEDKKIVTETIESDAIGSVLSTENTSTGLAVFPKTLRFTSEKDVTLNAFTVKISADGIDISDDSVDKTEASYTIVNGAIELKAKDVNNSVKLANRGRIEFVGSSQMTWTTENPSTKTKMVFVFKRSGSVATKTQTPNDLIAQSSFVGEQWYFDFAVYSFPGNGSKVITEVLDAKHSEFNSTDTDGGRRMVFPKTLSFTSNTDVTVNAGTLDKAEATFSIVNGVLALSADAANVSIKSVGGLIDMGNSQMTLTTVNPATQVGMVFVYKRSK